MREERAPGAGPRDARSPFSAVVSTHHPSVPSSEFPGPAGALEGLGLPASRAVPAPESIRPAPRFVGSSGAAAADPSPRVGNRFRPGQTLPESASIGAALHFPSPLRPPTDAKGPGRPIRVSTPSQRIQVSPGRRKRENRLKLYTAFWGGRWGWGERLSGYKGGGGERPWWPEGIGQALLCDRRLLLSP